MGFWSDITGRTARREADAAYRESSGMLDQAGNDIRTGYSQAQGYIQPYAQQGTAANTMYNDAVGINGTAPRAAAQQSYLSDPIFGELARIQNRDIFAKYNAGGLGDSGASRLAVGRAGIEGYGNWLDRLKSAGSQGFQAATSQAELARGQGNALADLQTTRAGNRINYGNARAQASQQGANTLLGLGTGLASLAIGGATPGVSGASAFGNILGGLRR